MNHVKGDYTFCVCLNEAGRSFVEGNVRRGLHSCHTRGFHSLWFCRRIFYFLNIDTPHETYSLIGCFCQTSRSPTRVHPGWAAVIQMISSESHHCSSFTWNDTNTHDDRVVSLPSVLQLCFHSGKDIIAWITNKMKTTEEGRVCKHQSNSHLNLTTGQRRRRICPVVGPFITSASCLCCRVSGVWHHVGCLWLRLPPAEPQEAGPVQRQQPLPLPGKTKRCFHQHQWLRQK